MKSISPENEMMMNKIGRRRSVWRFYRRILIGKGVLRIPPSPNLCWKWYQMNSLPTHMLTSIFLDQQIILEGTRSVKGLKIRQVMKSRKVSGRGRLKKFLRKAKNYRGGGTALGQQHEVIGSIIIHSFINSSSFPWLQNAMLTPCTRKIWVLI